MQNLGALVDLILESRIWKTLQGGGALLLRLASFGSRGMRSSGTSADGTPRLSPEERRQEIHLRCDSLPLQPTDPFSGIIEVTGWALAKAGVENVEVSVDAGSAAQARYGLARPDIQQLFPGAKNAVNCGYSFTLDTRTVDDGIHRVSITAYSKNGRKRELSLPLLVNQRAAQNSEYARWLEVFDQRQPELVRLKMSGFSYCPTVSVLVPVFRTKPEILRETIESVRRQSYADWQLCLVDDGSEDSEISGLLAASAAEDERIHIATMERESGISAASNQALEMASGDYVALLDHDDVLAEDALALAVEAMQREPRPDVLYSDEDHMDRPAAGSRRFSNRTGLLISFLPRTTFVT